MSKEKLKKEQQNLISSINSARLEYEDYLADGKKAKKELVDSKKKLEQNKADIESSDVFLKNKNIEIKKAIKEFKEKNSNLNDVNSIIEERESQKGKLEDDIIKIENRLKNRTEDIEKEIIKIEEEYKIRKKEIKKEKLALEKENENLLNNNLAIIETQKEDKEKADEILKGIEDDLGHKVLKRDSTASQLEKNLEEIKTSQEEKTRLNTVKDSLMRAVKKAKKDLKEIDKQKEVEQNKLDSILFKAGNLVAREAYVKGQEEYLKDENKKIGLKYQPYA